MSAHNVARNGHKILFVTFLCFDLLTSLSAGPVPHMSAPRHVTSVLAGPGRKASVRQMTSVVRQTVRERSGGHKPHFQCWSTPDDLPAFMPLTQPCFYAAGVVQCRCSQYLLDCSSNYGNLTFVPRVLPEAKVVNLSNNLLPSLAQASFFSNLSAAGVWLLDLYNNNMDHLTGQALAPFTNLTTLLIGGNRLSTDDLRTSVFMVRTLRKLDMKCGGLTNLPPGFFNRTLAVRLENLDLSWNRIRSLNMEVLRPLKNLKGLTMWQNKMYDLHTAFMPSLRYVSFHKNSIQEFPQTCKDGTNKSLFPNLKVLNLNFNQITELADPICLPRLCTLNLNYNRIQHFYTNMFSLNRFPALFKLMLNQMENKIRHVGAFAINNSRVNRITFGLNSLDFSIPQIHPDFFGGCHSVEILFVNKNNFHRVSAEKFKRLLQPMPLLTKLYLSSSQIEILDRRMFSNMTHLQTLYLHDNDISTLPDGVFQDLQQLVILSLANNHLTTITTTTFSPQTIARLRSLDLSRNPFRCDCDIVWFQQWLKSQPQLFASYQNQSYSCANQDNTTVQHFFVSTQECVLSHLAANNIIIIMSVIIVIILVVTVLYGHRWHFRLWLYEICRGRHQRQRRQQARQLHPFVYDVFLAYAEEDSEWVLHKLLPTLEDRWGLKVCLHQRDFVPGKHIVDNISDCTDNSDQFLMVFSPNFAHSPWCQFELKVCQTCVMDRDDVMVLVMLQETESRDLTGAMLALLRTTTYIEWEDDVNATMSFWGRLHFALSDVIENRTLRHELEAL